MRPQIPLRRLVLDAVVAASIVIGLWSAPGTTPATLADCDTSIRIVTRPAEARGSTFLGTAIGVTDEPADSSVTFDVATWDERGAGERHSDRVRQR